MRPAKGVAVLSAVIATMAVGTPAASADTTSRAQFERSLTLRGFDGERIRVRPYRLTKSLPYDEFDQPRQNHRYVGIDVSMKNVGRRTYSDSPANGARVVTTAGRVIDSSVILTSGRCDGSFGSSLRIPPRQIRRGCLAFEVHERSNLRYFEMTLNSGFASHTGQWRLPR